MKSPTSVSSATILALILVVFSGETLVLAAHASFETCRVATSCGDQPINYPFFINHRFCGFPGFQISCSGDNKTLAVHISGEAYVIHRIHYNNNSFVVSNAAFPPLADAGACVAPVKSLYLTGTPYKLADGDGEGKAVILRRCDTAGLSVDLGSYRIGCDAGTTDASVLAVPEGDGERLRHAREFCGDKTNVTAPLGRRVEGMGTREALSRGFVLMWTVSDCTWCNTTGGKCGYDYVLNHFRCFCADRPHAARCDPPGDRNLEQNLALGLGLSIGSALCFLIGFILYRRHKRKLNSSNMISRNVSDGNMNCDVEAGSVFFGVPVFSYKDLQEATNNFDSEKELGDGGFGTVYYGVLKDGREVAVKRLYEHNYRRLEQFITEIEILTRLRHKNLVSLYGCTSRRCRELLLVYEFIPNGTVADHLHGHLAPTSPLPWPLRLVIALETADALAFLHASDTVHRDVKTANILLDANFSVKVADFGLSRLFPSDVTHVSTAPQGTPGYVDPEYHQCYQLTSKSDVYSFGVVLAELISSKPAVDITRHRHEINLSNLAVSKIQKRAYGELIDPGLGVERATVAVAELAFQCLQQDKEMRPTMEEVLEELRAIRGDDERSLRASPSPECDEVGLLRNGKVEPPSPTTVTEAWLSSRSTTPNIST